MLLQLEAYLEQHPKVTVAELSLYLRAPQEVVQEMLELLQRKGRLRRALTQNASCGDNCQQRCQGCEGGSESV
jgi:hypothetical protein